MKTFFFFLAVLLSLLSFKPPLRALDSEYACEVKILVKPKAVYESTKHQAHWAWIADVRADNSNGDLANLFSCMSQCENSMHDGGGIQQTLYADLFWKRNYRELGEFLKSKIRICERTGFFSIPSYFENQYLEEGDLNGAADQLTYSVQIQDFFSKSVTVNAFMADYVIDLYPKLNGKIRGAPSYENLKEVSSSRGLKLMVDAYEAIPPSLFRWRYSVKGGSLKKLNKSGSLIHLRMEDFPEANIADLITVYLETAKGLSEGYSFRFYPELPQLSNDLLYASVTPQNTSIKSIQLQFKRDLNQAVEERFTLVSVYKKPQEGKYNYGDIIESELVFQKAVDIRQLDQNKSFIVDFGEGLKYGTYILTVEGSVRNCSNRPGTLCTQAFSTSLLSPLFPIGNLRISNDVISLADVLCEAPLCFGGFGKLSLVFHQSSIFREYAFYRMNEQGKYEAIKPGNVIRNDEMLCYEFENIFKTGKHTINVREAIFDVMTGGRKEIDRVLMDISIPERETLEAKIYGKDFSGYYAENGLIKAMKDAKIYADMNQLRGSFPPFVFSYRRNGGGKYEFTDTLFPNSPGKYEIFMRDSKGCENKVETVDILQIPDTLWLDIAELKTASCYGSDDASLSLFLRKGNSSVSIRWEKNGQIINKNGMYATELDPGHYKIKASNHFSPLVSVLEVDISEPSPLETYNLRLNNASCYGTSDGRICLLARGGTSPYKYYWSSGETKSCIEFKKAAPYSLLIRDANGCELKKNFTIAQPDSLRIFVDNVKDPYYTASNIIEAGGFQLRAQGGLPPYTFYMQGQKLSSLTPRITEGGTYYAEVLDRNACRSGKSQNLVLYEDFGIQTSSAAPSCQGSSDGSCYLSFQGGRPPYSINWSNGKKDVSISQLAAGEYTVEVEDANGLKRSSTISVLDPEILQIDSISIKDLSYYGSEYGHLPMRQNNAQAVAFVRGGLPPYTFVWEKTDAFGKRFVFGGSTKKEENLSGGTYYLSCYDKNNCFTEKTFQIQFKENLYSEIQLLKALRCYADSNGALEAYVEGGTPPYTYQWFKDGVVLANQSSVKIIELQAGNYELEIKDAWGVISKSKYTLTQEDALSVKEKIIISPTYYGSHNGEIRPNDKNGRVYVEMQGGSGEYSFYWAHLPEQDYHPDYAFVNSLDSGLYSFSVKDKNGCLYSDTVYVHAYKGLKTKIHIKDSIDCYGENKGSLYAQVEGGRPPYNYTWLSQTQSGDTLKNLKSNYYFLELRDANNVLSTDHIYLPQAPALKIEIKTENPLCSYSADGKMEALIQGGTPPYDILWSNGLKTNSVFNLYEDSLSVFVRDQKNCESKGYAKSYPPAPIQMIADTMNPSYGSIIYGKKTEAFEDGRIELRTYGGSGQHRYLWSTGENTSLISDLGAGVYTVEVQDSNACIFRRSFYLSPLEDLWAKISIKQKLLCYADSNGILEVDIKGGVAPYRIEWLEKKQNGERLEKLSSGTYHLSVRDANNVVSLDSLVLSSPSPIQAQFLVDSVSGWGASDGSINCQVQGGTPPYDFLWSDQVKEGNRENIPSAFYQVEIRDSAACFFSAEVYVPSPLALACSSSIKACSYAGCVNAKEKEPAQDGEIRIYPYGGVPPYRCFWQHGDTAFELRNLRSGVYYVEIRDKNKYTYRDTFYIESVPNLVAEIKEVDSVLCYAQSTAIIEGSVKGGKKPYTYTWYKNDKVLGSTHAVLNNLSSGYYRLSVKDSSGIVSTFEYILKQPDSLQIHFVVDSTSGFGRRDGRISALVEGGSPPYFYSWSRGDKDRILDSVAAGKYSLHIADRKACQKESSVQLYSPNILEMYAEVQACTYYGAENGEYKESEHDGSIELFVQGGTPPYYYQWSSGQVQSKISSLTSGKYRVKLLDKYDNIIEDSFYIERLKPLIVKIKEENPVSCFGEKDAVLKLEISGGTPPYTYYWKKTGDEKVLSENDSLKGVGAGTYSVYVYDRLQILSYANYEVQEPQILKVQAYSDSTSGFEREDGRVWAQASGGTPAYFYQWRSFEGDIFYGRENASLKQGVYSVRVRDQRFCADSTMVIIASPAVLKVKAQIQHAGHSGSINGIAQEQPCKGSIDLQLEGGVPPYVCLWDDQSSGFHRTNLCAGKYACRIRDAKGNEIGAFYEITSPQTLMSEITSIKTPSCFSRKDGALGANIQGGLPPYTYSWYVVEGEEELFLSSKDTLQNIGKGMYVLRVFDKEGISSEFSFHFQEPDSLSWVAQIEEPLCAESSDGSVSLKISGGNPPYSVDWMHGAKGERLSRLKSKTYKFRIVDRKFCHIEDSIFIAEPDKVFAQAHWVQPSCFGFSDATAEVFPEGGTPPYQIKWEDSLEASFSRQKLSATTYIYTITDTNLCQYSSRVDIQNPIPLQIEIIGQEPLCPQSSDAGIELEVSGGRFPYHLSINNSKGLDTVLSLQLEDGLNKAYIKDLVAAKYYVFLQDSFHCQISDSIILNEKENFVVEAEISEAACQGEGSSVHLHPRGGTAPYRYQWLNTVGECIDSVSALHNVPEGEYILLLRDMHACQYTDTFYFKEPQSLHLEAKIKPISYTGNRGVQKGIQKNDGSIELQIQGGTPPYTYLWNNGSTDSCISQLSVGLYQVKVEDSQGCSKEESFLMEAPLPLEANIKVIRPISCYNGSDGILEVKIEGGEPPYQIGWIMGDTTSIIQKLNYDNYEVRITDARGVIAWDDYYFIQPRMFRFAFSVDSVSCEGGLGNIKADLQGGTAPYRLTWSNGSKTPSVSDLPAGMYSLKVEDGNDCVYMDSVFLAEPDGIQIEVIQEKALCRESLNIIDVQIQGGLPPYTYYWQAEEENIQSETALSYPKSVEPGKYKFSVQDSRSCRRDTLISILSPPELRINIEKERVLCKNQQIEICPEITYQTKKDTYAAELWEKYKDSLVYVWEYPDKTQSYGSTLISALSGMHYVYILEKGGCLSTDSVLIIESQDSIASEFWITTQTKVGERVLAVNVSSPPSDSVRWILPDGVELLNAQGDHSELYFRDTGSFLIELLSYRKACYQLKRTRVRVYSEEEMIQKAANKPSIFSECQFSPNPFMEEADLRLVLDQDAQVLCRIWSLASASMIFSEQRFLKKGEKQFFRISDHIKTKGTYVIHLETAHENKMLKIIKL